MFNEEFLINPPRRKGKASGKKRRVSGGRKRRRAGAGIRRHRPVVYGPAGGPWHRSPWYRSHRKRKVTLANPGLALVGNPRRRRRRSGKRRAIRHYRRNPAMGLQLSGSLNQIVRVLPLTVTGIASGVVHEMVPGMLNLTNPWMTYGAKTAAAVLGGQVIGRTVGSDHGLVWTVVGMASVVKDLVRQYLPGVIPGLGAFPGTTVYPSYYEAPSVGAFPVDSSSYEDSAYLNGVGESAYPF